MFRLCLDSKYYISTVYICIFMFNNSTKGITNDKYGDNNMKPILIKACLNF